MERLFPVCVCSFSLLRGEEEHEMELPRYTEAGATYPGHLAWRQSAYQMPSRACSGSSYMTTEQLEKANMCYHHQEVPTKQHMRRISLPTKGNTDIFNPVMEPYIMWNDKMELVASRKALSHAPCHLSLSLARTFACTLHSAHFAPCRPIPWLVRSTPAPSSHALCLPPACCQVLVG